MNTIFATNAILLTAQLAFTTTLLLLLFTLPLAWWLSQTKSKLKPVIEAIVALPIILPPTVLGFYLLWFLGPQGIGGDMISAFGAEPLPFTFKGLVVGSFFYSLPFVVQPIQNSFEAIGQVPFDVAATLRVNRLQSFFRVILPLAKNGILTAAVLGFAHTVGEFGVVLMLGGNIPGKTRVLSVEIFDYVEALEFEKANELSLLLMGFSFICLFILYFVRSKRTEREWSK